MQRLNTFSLLLPEIKELLKAHDSKSVAACLKEVDPIDLADGWQALSEREQAAVFGLLPRRLQSQLFEELDLNEQKVLIENLKDDNVESLVSSLDASSTSRVARKLPPRLLKKFMDVMKLEDVVQVQQSLSYEAQTVASIMRNRFMTVNPGWTTHHALERIRHNSRLKYVDDLYLDPIFVVDTEGHLIGSVPLKNLIAAPTEMHVSVLMDPKSHTLSPEMDQELAANLFRKYKLSSAPVVDENQKPIGIVLVRDVLKVIQDETEEDFAKMAGTRQGLLSLSIFNITRIRFPWLIATCIGYFAVGAVVKHYELTLTKVIGLASFMPLIAAMGGNVGSQTATAVVRGMATGEVKALGKLEVVTKEALVGILLGSIYALGTGIIAHFIYGDRFGWNFSLVVGLGMFASMSSAAIMGSLEPFIFERMKIDPATATGPLITFFADLTSTSVYLTIATWLFMKFNGT